MTDQHLQVATAAPISGRIPMSHVSFSVVVPIGLGALILGAGVGLWTGNLYFSYLMVGLPLVVIFTYGIFAKSDAPTQPTGGLSGPALPIVALVMSCVSTSLVGIALGHASRHLIKTRGGEGEKIALAALIVGYSVLAIEVAAVLWLIPFFSPLLNVTK